MNTEEKARAYDEALKRAKSLIGDTIINESGQHIAEVIFPELFENKDERARRELIDFLSELEKLGKNTNFDRWSKSDCADWLAWLEKQGEQKPFDYEHANIQQKDFASIEPDDLIEESYQQQADDLIDMVTENLAWSEEDDYTLNETIQHLEELIRIDKSKHCGVDVQYYQRDIDWLKSLKYRVQPQLLPQQECEIEHIEHGKYYYCIKDYYSGGNKRASKGEVVQALRGMNMMALGAEANKYFIPVKSIVGIKPAWGKEDERNLQGIIDEINANKNNAPDYDLSTYDRFLSWLKSLKDKVQPQNLTVTDEELTQAKKDAYNDALDKIEYHSGEPTFDDGWSAAIWYLKIRNVQPQNIWKPSDEQMKALHDLNLTGNISYAGQGQELINLYNDLKKLREE